MTQFRPGESGNPAGKPKGARSRFTKMREALADDLPGVLPLAAEVLGVSVEHLQGRLFGTC